MASIVWDPSLETGVVDIDDQHRSLFRLASELQAAIESEACDDETIANAVYALTDYVTQHFADEEDLMHETGYPASGPHRAQHELLAGETLRYVSRYFNGDALAACELAPFVMRWLRNHILNTDARFAAWYREHANA